MRHLFIAALLLIVPAISFADIKDVYLLQDKCVSCHIVKENTGKGSSVLKWKESVHFRADSGCVECHGGNKLLAMDFQKGHIGIPTKSETVMICGKCHQEAVGDFLNRAKDSSQQVSCLVTCTDCHDYHLVKKSNAAEIISPVNCGKCHQFEKVKYMADDAALVKTAIAETNDIIADYESQKFPTQADKIEMEKIAKSFARSYHSRKLSKLRETSVQESLKSISELKKRMGENSPRNWKTQGALVILFLVAAIVLILLYQKSLHSKK